MGTETTSDADKDASSNRTDMAAAATTRSESPSLEQQKPGGAANSATNGAEAGGGNQHGSHADLHINPAEALTPDPRTIDMFHTKDNNKFAFSPGHLGKLINPKSLSAFYALGGLRGIEKGLQTNRFTGLSVDETSVGSSVAFEDVVAPGTAKYGKHGNTLPEKLSDGEADADGGDGGKKKKNKKNKSDSPTPDLPPIGHVDANSPFADRKLIFRDNRLPEKKSKSLFRLILETWNDKVLILLTIAAIVSLALGLYETFGTESKPGVPKVEWVEGVAIMVAVIIVVLVGSINDWQMEKQFNKLNRKRDDRTVKVIRSGKSAEVSVFDIMVGDVMHLSTGDIVPVDGIFIDGHGLKADESSATGESDILRKVPADEVYDALSQIANPEKGATTTRYTEKELEKLDPFIISGSKITEGTGTFLVTAVGVNSSYGRTTMALQTEASTTPLQVKLESLSEAIAWFGLSAGLLLFIVLFIRFLVELPHNTASAAEKGKEFLDIFIVAVTIIVVAVPEGLPLAVTLALAYATTRMLKDQNFVRVLKACETMGNATTVCSDKTGTLTQNKMTVTALTLGTSNSFGGAEKPMDGSEPLNTGIPVASSAADLVGGLSGNLKRMLIQANAVNSTAFEGEQDGEQTFIGSKTEVALLTFSRDLLGAGPVQEERSNAKIIQVVPFDSAVKYMATVVELPGGKFRAYVKGASEILLGKCTRRLADPASDDFETTTAELTGEDSEKLQTTIKSYASQTLRTIALSYRDFDSWPPPEAVSKEDSRMADFNSLHRDMTLVAIFGIKDPLRATVKQAIKDCQRAGVVVRMVTGDNISTGSAIAYECGIYHPENGGIAMQGPDFRVLTEKQLVETVPKLEVLARSSPEDKRILVEFLKRTGETVAVTGDGTNDAPALKLADVGFSMGIAGTEVAKEASDIILMDDNFASIVKGLKWGRAVNDSVKKFLQFQLTVNVTAVALTFVSAVASSDQKSILIAVQLLWVNLIMDTLAALALATDPPADSVLDRKPDRKSAPLITAAMCKMIIIQSIIQLVITFVLNFGGMSFFGYDKLDDGNRRLGTLVFNTFVWLQIFNEINCRRLDNKFNIFEGIRRNPFFIVITFIMIGGQVLIIFVGGEAFQVTPLKGWEWGCSIGLGAVSLPAGALARMLPDRWFSAIGGKLGSVWRRITSILPKRSHKDEDEVEEAASTSSADVEQAVGTNKRVRTETPRPHPKPQRTTSSKPHRTMSMLRGSRTERSIGFRTWLSEKKDVLGDKLKTSSSKA